MDENFEPIALTYWTREDEEAIRWAHLLSKLPVKFTMTAYNEGYWRDLIVFLFRIEPVPDDSIKKYLEGHGFTNGFFVYKSGETEKR